MLSSRATDAAGNSQPVGTPWDLKGYADNEDATKLAIDAEAALSPAA